MVVFSRQDHSAVQAEFETGGGGGRSAASDFCSGLVSLAVDYQMNLLTVMPQNGYFVIHMEITY